MKKFLNQQWDQPGFKLLTYFAVFFSIIWTTVWSIQDNAFNPVPLMMSVSFVAFYLLMAYLFRNNK